MRRNALYMCTTVSHWGFMGTVPYNMTVFECESMVAAARLDTSACKRYLSTRYAAY